MEQDGPLTRSRRRTRADETSDTQPRSKKSKRSESQVLAASSRPLEASGSKLSGSPSGQVVPPHAPAAV
eukprot:290087-Hanusia_phi.AAC.2